MRSDYQALEDKGLRLDVTHGICVRRSGTLTNPTTVLGEELGVASTCDGEVFQRVPVLVLRR